MLSSHRGGSMLIIWGTRLFGKVDQVGKDVHVATKFFHLWYVPLIPLESWVVVAQDGDGWRGFPLKSMRWKSALIAWLRVALIVAALWGVATGLSGLGMTEHLRATILSGVVGVAAAVALFFSYRLTRADEDMIITLGRVSGMSDPQILAHLGRDVAARASAPTTPTGF